MLEKVYAEKNRAVHFLQSNESLQRSTNLTDQMMSSKSGKRVDLGNLKLDEISFDLWTRLKVVRVVTEFKWDIRTRIRIVKEVEEVAIKNH